MEWNHSELFWFHNRCRPGGGGYFFWLGPRGTQGGTILVSKKFSAPESMSSPILLYHYLQNLVTSFCFLLSIFKSMPFLGWGRCFSTVPPRHKQLWRRPRVGIYILLLLDLHIMSFACRARRFHILRSFYNTSQVIKPLLLQVDYKMVRQTLAFLVLFIVVTLQSAQIQGYSFWKLCVGVCVGPIPFWVPGCQRLCWALSYQGAHSMPALAETFFPREKRCFLSMV